MNKSASFYCLLILVVTIGGPCFADLISVSGLDSVPGDGSPGVAPIIISAPSEVLDDNITYLGQVGFDERQGVTTTTAYEMDYGVWLPAGSVVDSHMIFLNGPGGTSGITHSDVVWTFSEPIIGVMSDNGGTFEAASTAELGWPGTIYPTAVEYASEPLSTNRGMEKAAVADSYSIVGNQLTLSMGVGQPGDWIRVITPVPAPGAVFLGSIGLSFAGWKLRRRRTQ